MGGGGGSPILSLVDAGPRIPAVNPFKPQLLQQSIFSNATPNFRSFSGLEALGPITTRAWRRLSNYRSLHRCFVDLALTSATSSA